MVEVIGEEKTAKTQRAQSFFVIHSKVRNVILRRVVCAEESLSQTERLRAFGAQHDRYKLIFKILA